MYLLKTECHLDFYMAYIFLNERILQPFLRKCVYIDGLKYKTWNFARHLSANYFLRLFLHNLGVLNLNMSVNILSLVSFTFK